MTIGIAIHAPRAAQLALAALRAVEHIGRGAIGGFVSLRALGRDGQVLALHTQRGGAAALSPTTWPPGLAEARHVVLMSSGPDRPEPLAQFTPASAGVGLVTGHRLPNMRDATGSAPNLRALALLAQGVAPEAAVAQVLAQDPHSDAGLIAMDMAGRIGIGNSALVARRDDLGMLVLQGSSLQMAVLHNSIYPHDIIAPLAIATARDKHRPLDSADHHAPAIGLRVRTDAPCRALILEARTGQPARIETPDRNWGAAEWEGAPLMRGDPVLRDNAVVGTIRVEVYCITASGRIRATRGQDLLGWGPD
ncbi:MAG: DUF6963 family protein [Roseinatronobacter sp.]